MTVVVSGTALALQFRLLGFSTFLQVWLGGVVQRNKGVLPKQSDGQEPKSAALCQEIEWIPLM